MKQAKYKKRLAFESRIEALINCIGAIAFIAFIGMAMELAS